MKIEERPVGSVVVLDLAGRLVAGEGVGQLKDKINSLILQGTRQILMNLAGVSYIDSNGLGELVAAHTTMVRNEGQIKLVNLADNCRKILEITRLEHRFECHTDLAAALKTM